MAKTFPPQAPTPPHRPYVMANLAMSADGKIAAAHGPQGAVASREDRRRMDVVRARADAVLIGASTLRAANPPLHLRDAEACRIRLAAGRLQQPRAIVLSASGDLPSHAKAFAALPDSCTGAATDGPVLAPPLRPLVVTTALGLPSCRARLGDTAEIWQQGDDSIEVAQLLGRLAAAGVGTLLVEGGGETLWHFVALGALDELWLTVAPCILGGAQAPTPIGGPGLSLAQRLGLRLAHCEVVGDEIYCRYLTER